jgi:hypothetical protein
MARKWDERAQYYLPGEDKHAYDRRQARNRIKYKDQQPNEASPKEPVSPEAYMIMRNTEFLTDDYDEDDLPTVDKILHIVPKPEVGTVKLTFDAETNNYLVIVSVPADEVVGENPTTDANERAYVHKLDGDDPLLASINRMNREGYNVVGSDNPPKDRTTVPAIGDESMPNISGSISSKLSAPKKNIRDTFTRYRANTESARLRAQNQVNKAFYNRNR